MKTNFIERHLAGVKADTPSKILLAALAEFGNAPAKNVGTRDIARRAGVNISAISYYFNGKDELYSELINHIIAFMEKVSEEFRGRFAELKANPSAAAARALLRDYVSWRIMCMENKNSVFKSMISIVLREEFNNTRHFKKIYERVFSKTDAMLQESITMAMGGKVAPERAKIISVALTGAIMRFNAVPDSVLKTLGWESLEARRLSKISGCVLDMLDGILDSERAIS